MISAINFTGGKYQQTPTKPIRYRNTNSNYNNSDGVDSFQKTKTEEVNSPKKSKKPNKAAKTLATVFALGAITGGAVTGTTINARENKTDVVKNSYLSALATNYSEHIESNPYNSLTINALNRKQQAQSEYGTLITDGSRTYIILNEDTPHSASDIKRAFDIRQDVKLVDEAMDDSSCITDGVIEVPSYRINQGKNVDLQGYIDPIELVESLSSQTEIYPKDYFSVSEWISALNIAVDGQKFPQDLDKDEVRDCLITNMPQIEKQYFG